MSERSEETQVNSNSGKKKFVKIEHVKYDFYEKVADLFVVVYVKEIEENSLYTSFEDSAFVVQFKTRSVEFLKLHEGSSEETVFEWHVNLRHRIFPGQSKHNLSKTKLTLILKKGNATDQWSSLSALYCEDNGVVTSGLDQDSKTTNNDDKMEYSNHVNNGTRSEQLCTENKTNGTTNLDINSCSSSTTCSQSTNKDDETNKESHELRSINCQTNSTFCCKNDNSEEQRKSIRFQCSSNGLHSSKGSYLKEIASDKNDCVQSKGSIQKINENRTSKDDEFSYDGKIHDCRPGAVGLLNDSLNNLCYLNAIVQCLSAVKELRAYLLGKRHCSSINNKNKYGFGGHLAGSFGTLVEELWSGSKRSCSAKELKNVLGRKHKCFTQFGQGDAQEFLTFLLDGLHEDLKNEEKEVINELETECQKSTMEKGQQYWKKFINGNQSIINDLFHGLTVSEIRCKHCKQPSVKFDPWMQLNLPIPNDPKYLPIYVFFQDPTKTPLKVKLKVCQGTICLDLLTHIGKLVNIPANHFVLFRPQNSRIFHIYEPMEELAYSCIKEYLVACQIVANNEAEELDEQMPEDNLPDQQLQNGCKLHENRVSSENHKMVKVLRIPVIQRSACRLILKCSFCLIDKTNLKYCGKCFLVAYCNSECQKQHWKSHRSSCTFRPEIIGCPFILSIPSSQATLSELKKKALHYASFSVAAKNVELENVKFQLRLLENLTDFRSRGKLLTENGNISVVNGNVCLALDWSSETRDCPVRSCVKIVCESHESVKNKLSAEDKLCYLENCLKLYWNPETINKATGWRCDHCKDVRAADREMTVFKHPKNMIIHIKRFSYVDNGKKIGKVVRFPLRDLDMSQFSYPHCNDEAIYDLRAVCCHYGIMNFGHYVAYSKPYSLDELNSLGWANTDGWLKYNDRNVSCVTESDVAKAEAYILFYQRREKNPTILNTPSPCSTSILTNTPAEATESKSSGQGVHGKKIGSSFEIQNEIQSRQGCTTDQFCSEDGIPQEDQLD